MLSTCHDTDLTEIRQRTRSAEGGVEVVKKPKLVNDYNTHMGGVDMSDQLILYYGYPHRLENWNNILITLIYRSVKWWKRVFFHLVDLSIVNANILYNEVSNKPMAQLDFRIAIILSLLEGHSPRVQQCHYVPNRELPMRLTERPFPEKIQATTPSGGRPQCEVCRAKGIRSQTRHRCKICKTPLHIDNCFEAYHTILYYGRQ